MKLIKCSSPGWVKDFDRIDELVDELRSHICGSCRFNKESTYTIVNDDGIEEEYDYDDPVIDVIHEGVLYECRDVNLLLGTACGCEFSVEFD